MLPHVDPKNGHLSAYNRVLVLGGHDPQAAAVLDQPAPSTALQAQESLCKGGFELVKATPRLGDGSHQGCCALGVGLGRAGRGQVVPEQGVVDVSAAVELDGVLEGDLAGNVVGRGGRCVGFEGVI